MSRSMIVLVLTVTACGSPDEGRTCTSVLKMAVGGTLEDSNGALVLADSVEATTASGGTTPCEVNEGRYACWDNGSDEEYSLTVRSGEHTSQSTVFVPGDGCHPISVAQDLVVEPGMMDGCPATLPLVAEVDTGGRQAPSQPILDPGTGLTVHWDGEPPNTVVRVYAEQGMGQQAVSFPLSLSAPVQECPSGVARTTISFMTAPEACGYTPVQVQIEDGSLTCE